MTVLEERVRVLEVVTSNARVKTKKSSKAFITTSKLVCSICQAEHSVFKCKKLTDLPVNQRLTMTRKLNLCINCLGSSHRAHDCKSGGCRICQKRHHTLLHLKINALKSQPQQNVCESKPTLQNISSLYIKDTYIV